MWTCNCGDDGKGPSTNYVKLTPTKVDDGVCTKCGFYAVWDSNFIENTCEKSTVYKIGSRKPVKKFKTKVEAAKFLKVKTTYLNEPFNDRRPYSPKDSEYVLYPRDCSSFPSEIERIIVPPTVKVYHEENGFIGEYNDVKTAAKAVGDSYAAAMSNRARGSITTAKGHIYTQSNSFDLETYLVVKSKQQDFLSASDWKYDTVYVTKEEIDVGYEKDTYGTWQDLLYS
jgi:hypothetical protein